MRSGRRVALQPLEIGQHVGGVLVAQAAILLERLVDDPFELGGQLRDSRRTGDTGALRQDPFEDTADVAPVNGCEPVAIS